jgi:hypothetical protein
MGDWNGVAADIGIDLPAEVFTTMWLHLRRKASTAAVATMAAWPVNARSWPQCR